MRVANRSQAESVVAKIKGFTFHGSKLMADISYSIPNDTESDSDVSLRDLTQEAVRKEWGGPSHQAQPKEGRGKPPPKRVKDTPPSKTKFPPAPAYDEDMPALEEAVSYACSTTVGGPSMNQIHCSLNISLCFRSR